MAGKNAVNETRVDVVIIGGGLAGLTLARHLLLDTDKTVLLLERRDTLPSPRQKVGESSVQIAGYYYGKVLDLEEYLWLHQYMKYNLRFYWKSAGRDNSRFEDYAQAYIRPFSNIPSYQLDRNTFEAELLRRNRADPRFTARLGVKPIQVDLAEEADTPGSNGSGAGREPHTVRFTTAEGETTVRADWVVDTSGRGRFLARKLDMKRANPIRHGAFFWWVDGLVDIDRLTDASRREIRMKKSRRATGHLPTWLATNHFCAEGLWFWVIPLQGKTSLGIVFDKSVVDHHDVFTVEKATRWVCEKFPCFARDLPQREVLDFGGLADFSYDCVQTISDQRWALAGEAGRFTDPLYSPGSDLISIYNTLIVDAITTDDPGALSRKCQRYEQLMRAVYQAYVPTYAVSYDALGDPEVFSLKYAWELTVYFGGYVFPFINDLFTDKRFMLAFMRQFMRLGPINHAIQRLLSDYYQWKKTHRQPLAEPVFFDFTELGPLREAAETFFQVGVTVDEAKKILAQQVSNLEEMARFIAAHVAATVLEEPQASVNAAFVAGIDLDDLRFDPEDWSRLWSACADSRDRHAWSFDPEVLARFATEPMTPAATAMPTAGAAVESDEQAARAQSGTS